MNAFITQLLFKNNCVIVPKVGAFLANYKNAYVDMHQNIIHPPQKTIAFNKQLNKNDGLLATFVSEQKMISYTSAEQLVNQFGDEVLYSLEKNRSFIFSGIGRLYKDSSDNILFESFEQENFLIENYGLLPVAIEPISRLKSENVIEPIVPTVAEKQVSASNKKSGIRWVLPVIIPFLLITIIGFLVMFSQFNPQFSKFDLASLVPNVKQLFEQKQNILKTATSKTIHPSQKDTTHFVAKTNIDSVPIHASISVVADNIIPIKQEIVQTEKPVEVKEPEKKPIVLENGKVANAFICVGSFKNESNAKEMQKMIDFLGLKSVVSKTKLHQVLVATSTTRAGEDLATLKEEIAPDAYIYCQNCNY